IAVVHASRRYDPSRGTPFKALASKSIRFRLLRLVRRRHHNTLSILGPNGELQIDAPAPTEPNGDDCDPIEPLLAGPPRRERVILEWYYGIGHDERKTAAAIGELLDLSHSRVDQLLQRALERLRAAVRKERELAELKRPSKTA